MCKTIDHPSIMPGWSCCRCHLYNGLQHRVCKNCGREPCEPVDFDELRKRAEKVAGKDFIDRHVPR